MSQLTDAPKRSHPPEIVVFNGSPTSGLAKAVASVFGIAILFFAAVCCVLGYRTGLATGGIAWIMVGIFAAVIGISVPWAEYHYLNMATGSIVKERPHLFSTTVEETPLSDFSEIVVRHVCHSTCEGADTFTGSVGLKPKAGGAVYWTKEFPATMDEIPTEAKQFARELARVTGLWFADYPP